MTQPSTGTVRHRLSDPRWHWLIHGAELIYAELGPGDMPRSLTLSFEDPDFACVLYSVFWGEPGMQRFMCTDPESASSTFDEAYVDITPDDTPEEIGGDLV
jgi:hypothetical protein